MDEFAVSRGTQSHGSSGRSWLSQALHNKVIAIVLAMIVAVPLFAAPADYSLTGIAAFTLESCALVLMTMLLWRAKWDLRPEQLRTFARTGANVPLLLFVGWVAISSALAPHKIYSIQYLMQIGAGALLYFAVAYQFRQSKHLSLLADVLLFLTCMVSIGGLAQYQLNDEARASALFGNAQPLGSFVMLMLPVIAALALGDKNAKRQTVAQITFVLMVGCLLLTQGRSAVLGGLAGLAMLAVLSSRVGERMQEKARHRRQVQNGTALPLKARKEQFVLPGLLVVIALGFVFAMNSQNGSVLRRAGSLAQLGTDVSWQSRVQEHWKGALAMIAERPLQGWGAGQFPLYQKSFTEMGAQISPLGTGTRVSLAEQAHNFYLQTAAELGVIGLALMLAVLGCFWIAAWHKIPRMEAGIRRTLLMATTAASVGFAVDAFGSPSWQYAQNSMFFWLLLGVGTSCLRPRTRPEVEVEVAQPRPYLRTLTLATRPVAVCLCLLGATLLPTSYSAAQAFGYNTSGKSENIFRVTFAVAALTALGYVIYNTTGGSDTDDGGTVVGGEGGNGDNNNNQPVPAPAGP